MSWQASDHVRRLRGVAASEKAVLYALADRHNTDDKGCWPRLSLLAAEAGIGIRATQRTLRRLEAKGVIRVTARKRKDGSAQSNFYSFVNLDDEPEVVSNVRGVVSPTTPHEPIIEPRRIRERYEQVFEKVPEAVPPVHAPDRYFAAFTGDLDFDPRNVAATIKVANAVRGERPERIQVPPLKFWPNLDRVGAFLRKENGKLNRNALSEAFDAAFVKVVGNKGGEGWDNILDGVAQAPEEFFTVYREVDQ